MASLIPTIISNLLRYMTSSSLSEAHIYNEMYNNIIKSIASLLILSVLLSSTILLICFGVAYYLWEQQFTFWQLFGIVLAIKSFLVLFFILFFKNTMQKIGNSTTNDKEEKPSNYNLVGSFMEGFNSKK